MRTRREQALKAVRHFRRGLAELSALDRQGATEESGPLFDLLAKFVEDWRAERSN